MIEDLQKQSKRQLLLQVVNLGTFLNRCLPPTKIEKNMWSTKLF